MSISLILYFLMLFFVVISVKRKNILKQLGFKKTKLLDETIIALFYVGLLITVSIVIGVFFYSIGFEKDLGRTAEAVRNFGLENVLTIIVFGSIIEEIFFRGYLQRKTNLLFASFVFAYFHIIYASLSEVVGAFFLGIILGYEFNKRKNLFTPILSHLLYNLIVTSMIFVVA